MRIILKSLVFFFVCLILAFQNKTFANSYVKKKIQFLKYYEEDNIKVLNNSYVTKEEIVNKIQIKDKNFFSLNLRKISNQILSIKEIKSIRTEKKFNGDILLFINEKEPISLWLRSEEKYLIDHNGEILKIKKNKFKDLLVVKGIDANVNASHIIKNINIFPKIKNNLNHLEFISKYRWDLHFKDNIIVKLPYRETGKALKFLSSLLKNNDVNINQFKIIDMRVNGKIFLR